MLSQQPLTHSSSWAHRCALSRKGRGHERRAPRILAKRTQFVILAKRTQWAFWRNEAKHSFGVVPAKARDRRWSWVPALAALGRDDDCLPERSTNLRLYEIATGAISIVSD
jgi:hypothetical protein